MGLQKRLQFLPLIFVKKADKLFTLFGVADGVSLNVLFGFLEELVVFLGCLGQLYFQLLGCDPFLLDHILAEPEFVLHFPLLSFLLSQRLRVQLGHLTHEQRRRFDFLQPALELRNFFLLLLVE